ncbi:MAG: hypothetical protein KGI08_04160 [Thaumarchaeota archaeon]|nr:hypothetical protein [Nitrososphaerota archaeon]
MSQEKSLCINAFDAGIVDTATDVIKTAVNNSSTGNLDDIILAIEFAYKRISHAPTHLAKK